MKQRPFRARKIQAKKGLTVKVYDPNIRKNHRKQGSIGRVYTKQELMDFAESRGLQVSDSVHTRKV